MLNILFVYMYVIGHGRFGKMGKLSTICRTNCVDRTLICLTIQELAGCTFIHPFALPVLKQPFYFKSLYGHVQMGRNSLQVFNCISRRHITAAIRAGKAINLFPHLTVYLLRHKIKMLRRVIFNFCKKPPKAGTMLQYVIIESSS